MKKRLLPVALLFGTFAANAQVGIGTATPNKSAELLIESSNRGLLIPNVALTSTTDKNTITNGNVQSLMVYATKTQGDITPGYYYWDINKWVRLTADKDIPQIVVNNFQEIVNKDGDKVQNIIKNIVKNTEGNVIYEGDKLYQITKEGDKIVKQEIKDKLTTISYDEATGDYIYYNENAVDRNGKIIGEGIRIKVKETVINKFGDIINNKTVQEHITNYLDGTHVGGNVYYEGDKITTVADGINTKVTSSVNPAGSNTTEYKVNVSNEAIQAAQKLTTVSQGAGVKVTPTTKEGSSTTDYNVAINTDGGNAGDVLTVVPPKEGTTTPSVEWKTPNYQNIYTHDGTLVSTEANFYKRTVDFGTFNSLMFKSGNQSHDFTYDNTHAGLNIRGNNTASIGLLSEGSTLRVEHKKDESLIQSNAEHGIKVVAESTKDISFGTSGRTENNDNVVFQGNGGVKVVNINKPEFKGEATDKVVVADTNGILKTVDRKKVAPQFFYMPAVIFNTKIQGTGLKRDLYQDYVNQFTGGKVGPGNANYNISHGAPGSSVLEYTGGIVGSEEAPADITVFEKGELHYYVTYYDTKVFKNLSISKEGVLTYDIIGTATPASYMNIVFVIK